MGTKQIQAGGQTYRLNETAKVAELKQAVGAGKNDLATYVEQDGSWVTLSDRDHIMHIPDNARVAFQPKDTYFGRGDRMNERRLQQELAALQEVYTVRLTLEGTVDLLRVTYPGRWKPQTGALRFAIPADYPASAPTVHVPAQMQHRDGKHAIRMRQSPYSGWKKWCVTFKDWNPRRHSLVTVTRQMMGSLSDPSKRRLFRE